MKCNECIFLPSETIWESKSKIEGKLGQESPFRNGDILYQTPGFQGQKEKHPVSGITKQVCQNCSNCHLIAHEAFFRNDRIIFEVIESKKIRLKKIVEGSTGNRNSDMAFLPRAIAHKLPHYSGKPRETYNFNNEPQEIKEAALDLVKKLFSVTGFLSASQANVVAKLKLGWKLRESTERNVKAQFIKKLRSLQYIVDYWEDFEEIIYE